MSIPAGCTISVSTAGSNDIERTIVRVCIIVVYHQPFIGVSFIHKCCDAALFSIGGPFHKLLGTHRIDFVAIGPTRLEETEFILMTRHIIINFQFSGSCSHKERFIYMVTNHHIFGIVRSREGCSCRPRPVILRHVFRLIGINRLCHCSHGHCHKEQEK